MPSLNEIGNRDGWICHLCGQPVPRPGEVNRGSATAPTRGHLIPRRNGGTSKPDNLRLAHRVCNQMRGHRLLKPLPPRVPDRMALSRQQRWERVQEILQMVRGEI